MLLAALAGLFASVYLFVVYTNNAPIVCGTGHGCDVVRASQWAYVFGVIPRPLLGVIFYTGVMVLLVVRTALPSWLPKPLYWLTMAAAGVGIVESAHLFYIQVALIQAFCNWCLVSTAATVVFAAAATQDTPQELTPQESVRTLQEQFISMAIAAVAIAVGLWWLLSP